MMYACIYNSYIADTVIASDSLLILGRLSSEDDAKGESSWPMTVVA